jgi:hypothetical protein
MKVMVTINVEIDLDIANGARGEIIKIVLDERETAFSALHQLWNWPIHRHTSWSYKGNSTGEPSS